MCKLKCESWRLLSVHILRFFEKINSLCVTSEQDIIIFLHLCFVLLIEKKTNKNIYIVEQIKINEEEARRASKEYFGGDELAAQVWVNKYALKDSQGNLYERTPADMHWRLAREIARIECKYPNPLNEQELFDLFDHFRYIVPQGSPMTGIGNNFQVSSLSNCFVIGVDGEADSYGGIFKIDE